MARKLNLGLALSLLLALGCLGTIIVFRRPRDTRPARVPETFRVPGNQQFLIYSDPPQAEVHQDNPADNSTRRVGPLTNGEQPFDLKNLRLAPDGKTVAFSLKKAGYRPKEFRVTTSALASGIWPPLSEDVAVLEPISFLSQVRERHPAVLILLPVSLLAAVGFWRLKEQEHRRLLALQALREEANGDPFVGTSVGEYRVHRMIGEGQYGKVYRATVDSGKGQYALKILNYQGEEAERVQVSRDRFDREMELLKKLQHPNIGRVVDFGRTENYDWVLMPFYGGGSLKSTLEQGALAKGEVLSYARDIASGLQAAHDAGIFHRDLKLENVMLHEGVAVLIDFGMARGGNQKTLTMEGSIMGSPLYMAPEQLSTSRVDSKADQYSYGVLLFQLLTGKSPFDESFDLGQLFGAKLMGRSFRLQEVDPTQSTEMDDVLAKMMSYKADERYPTLREAFEAFTRALGDSVSPDLPERRVR